MARGYDGAFGRRINDPAIWLGFCALFLIGLANWRRPLSLRNLDLLVLLSFSLSLLFFNRGEIFTAMPLVYPPLPLPARPHALDRLEGTRPRRAVPSGPSGSCSRRPSSRPGSRSG